MSEQSLSVDEIDARHGRYGEGFKNGWSLSLYNVIKGTNELRTSEYYDLIRELEWSAERIAQLERERDEAVAALRKHEFWANAAIAEQSRRAEQSDLALAEARREGLREALKIAENYEDVEDRSDGTQQGNLAMTICTELRDRIDAAISGNQPHTGD
jgi:hypothetical protein